MNLKPLKPRARTLLTIHVEDYYHVGAFHDLIQQGKYSRFETRVQTNVLRTLDFLDEYDIRATFFCLGVIADENPDLIREIVRRGHEIGTRGHYHRSIRELTPHEFREDLRRSRHALEQAGGQEVLGYRVADGWFGPDDVWALDVLRDEGFAYDSSIRPFLRSIADEPWKRFAYRYGTSGREIWEIPVAAANVLGCMVPICGGNYFRQLPPGLMHYWVKGWHERVSAPLVMYVHVWELDPEQPIISAASWLQRVRHYRGLDRMEDMLRYYFSEYEFASMGEYLGLEPAPVEPDTEPSPVEAITLRSLEAARIANAAPPSERTPVSVIVPCYNEEMVLPYLAKTLPSLEETMEDYAFNYVFVDDGSTDDTWNSLLHLWGDRPDCTIVRHRENQGVAAAILTGARHAPSEIVSSIDCDCTYDPQQLRDMIPLLESDPKIVCVTASPYHPQGSVMNVPSWRLVLSKGLSFLYRRLLHHKLATYTSCFRVYRRSAIQDLPVIEHGYLGVVEMLALLDFRGARILEAPAVLEVRLLGRSKMRTMRTILGHIKLLGRMVYRKSTGRKRAAPGAPAVEVHCGPSQVTQP